MDCLFTFLAPVLEHAPPHDYSQWCQCWLLCLQLTFSCHWGTLASPLRMTPFFPGSGCCSGYLEGPGHLLLSHWQTESSASQSRPGASCCPFPRVTWTWPRAPGAAWWPLGRPSACQNPQIPLHHHLLQNWILFLAFLLLWPVFWKILYLHN